MNETTTETTATEIETLAVEPAPLTAPSAQIAAPTAYQKTEVTTMTKTTNSYPFLSKAQIKDRLASDAAFRASCLLVLFDRQTQHEQATETTKNRNRAGFMSSHAVHGTRIAKKLRAQEELTDDDRAKLDEIVPRYTKQLAEHFRGEAIAANPDLQKTAAIFGV